MLPDPEKLANNRIGMTYLGELLQHNVGYRIAVGEMR